MSELLWSRVDAYFEEHLVANDPVLAKALANNAAAVLPAIDVTPGQGKLLYLYAKMIGARHILEIGTLGGYSTLWLAKALPPEGRIVTLELEPRHAEVARGNFAESGYEGSIETIVGPALDSLRMIKSRKAAPFDFVFIDADKASTLAYFQIALELCRPGAVIIADNVVRKGQVAEPGTDDPNVLGMRRLVDALSTETRVEATAVQTVGTKGYDGFIIARVRD